jgi:RNA polymerase sigma-70 factor, ECF subfamily
MDFNYRGEGNYRGTTGTHHGQVPPAREMAESEMIHRAKRRDAAAFESLYKLHSRRIFALCLRMLGNISEAEDLTQEAFLQLFRKIHLFRGESAFSTWLHRMAVNLVLMRLRRKAPPHVPLEGVAELSDANAQSFREIGRDDLSLAGSIDRICLEHAVAQLPACYRLVFELHDVQGYKHTEIAQMMECSVGTSKAQLHRAHKRLRVLLREKIDSGSGWFPPRSAIRTRPSGFATFSYDPGPLRS